MALSEYELRILQDLEGQLRGPKHPRWARVGKVCRAFDSAIAVGALAAIMVAAVFALGAAVAPIAGVLCAFTGYHVAQGRQRLQLRDDRPER